MSHENLIQCPVIYFYFFRGEPKAGHVEDILEVELLDWEGEARDVEDRTVPVVAGKFVRIQCGGHQNNLHKLMCN